MAKRVKTSVVPRLRFPEFRRSPDWELEPMDKLYSFMRNNALSRDKLNYEGGAVKNVHYGDIHTKFSPLFDITKEHVPYVNDSEDLPETDSNDYCVEGDLILADASEDIDDVGKCIEVVHLDGQLLLAGQHTILARRKNDDLIVGLGGHLFRSARVRAQLQKEAQGTKVYAISPTRLAGIEIAFPINKGEQRKIADCLNSSDEVIDAQERRVETLKTYKRGLMQQVFPREGESLPRLRFSKFRDEPEWREEQLWKVSPAIYDGTHQTPTYATTGVPFYSVENLISGSANKFISRADYLVATRKNRPAKGDILLTRIGRIGHSTVVTWDNEFSVYVTLAVIQCSQHFNSHYLHYFIQSERYQAELAAKSLPNAVPPKINLDSLRTTKVLLPREGEQREIADCLLSLDLQIDAETKKLFRLKTHNKGLMQQLLPMPEKM